MSLLSLYSSRLYIKMTIQRSSPLSINVLLIFDMHGLNGELLLNTTFCVLLFLFAAAAERTIAVLQQYKNHCNHKANPSIGVLNIVFLLTEYLPFNKHLLRSIFLSHSLIQLNCLIVWIYCHAPFYNTCLNCIVFPALSLLEQLFYSISCIPFRNRLWFHIFLVILFPTISSVATAALRLNYSGTIFSASSTVFVAVSDNFFPYLPDTFIMNDQNRYPLTYFIE